ncbi:MAG TPA: nitroreductase [Pilimelia sp.]|nr:nitroreductase [Pilimelia sp.]
MTTASAPSPNTVAAALAGAARQALRAPSVFNTQPWRWRVGTETLTLYADRGRQLPATDPDGRLLMLSCGAALHHARVALRAAGYVAEVARLPEPDRSDVIARIRLTGRRSAGAAELRLAAAIGRRRTDRRSFGPAEVPPAELDRLRDAVVAEGAQLHIVRPHQMPMLAVATARAAEIELADPSYRAELAQWTTRPPGSGDGVPATTAVRQGPRRVPIRDYALGTEPGLEIGDGNDRGAAYALLYGATDEPAAWLRAGEALSALLLTATAAGLSAAPLSDVVDVVWTRKLTRDLLAGLGEPYLVVRVGVGGDPANLPAAPRRDPKDVITGFVQGG